MAQGVAVYLVARYTLVISQPAGDTEMANQPDTHSHNTDALLAFLNRTGKGRSGTADLLRDLKAKGGKAALDAYNRRITAQKTD
jgi:hypothetical protein